MGGISSGRTRPLEFHKVMVFIDESNLLKSAERFQEGLKIDYGRLVQVLVGDRQLVRPHVFGSIGTSGNDETFYNNLRLRGFEVTLRPRTPIEKSRSIEKGADVALVTKMLYHGFNGLNHNGLIRYSH